MNGVRKMIYDGKECKVGRRRRLEMIEWIVYVIDEEKVLRLQERKKLAGSAAKSEGSLP